MKTKNIYLISSILSGAIALTTLANLDRISYRYGPMGSFGAIASAGLLFGSQAQQLLKLTTKARKLRTQYSGIIDEGVSAWLLIDHIDQEHYLIELNRICQRKLTSEDLHEK